MEDQASTELEYFDNMWKLESEASFLSCFQGEDGRWAMVLDSTIFHPQGGGQPADTGLIASSDSLVKFVVQDVRSKGGVVYHYGSFDDSVEYSRTLERGMKVRLHVNEARRILNSRLHSAGHLLDLSMANVGLGHLDPSKGYHFPDGPFVEYKGTIPQNELEDKRQELELDVNELISKGGKVCCTVETYEKAVQLCGGNLPDYIPKDSKPRIVKFSDNPGCPCGGTHVANTSDIKSIKVSQIRVKKGMTKVFYNVVDT